MTSGFGVEAGGEDDWRERVGEGGGGREGGVGERYFRAD